MDLYVPIHSKDGKQFNFGFPGQDSAARRARLTGWFCANAGRAAGRGALLCMLGRVTR